FRLGGKGNAPFRPGKGGIHGDLIIEVSVQEHPDFIRSGINLLYKLNVSLPMLILGGKIKLPTLDSTVEVSLKPKSKVGQILRLKGKGLSDQRGYNGDILVEINVITPQNITDKEKELLEQLSEMPNFKNN
ncbi:MAG: DnaJ C-terminal domain-containing protein, partial [bacterium]